MTSEAEAFLSPGDNAPDYGSMPFCFHVENFHHNVGNDIGPPFGRKGE